ncbi:MAG: RNase H1/viroplasmin domain-containing protein, partial [Maribacter sp.]|nr:RNase H1/viroplasmin domain-containing protein [Maribacter sp.]
MAVKKKFYVVWKGKNPGIYENWEACKLQIAGVKGAQYMSFSSHEKAKEAFNGPYEAYKGKKKKEPGLSAADLLKIGDPTM